VSKNITGGRDRDINPPETSRMKEEKRRKDSGKTTDKGMSGTKK